MRTYAWDEFALDTLMVIAVLTVLVSACDADGNAPAQAVAVQSAARDRALTELRIKGLQEDDLALALCKERGGIPIMGVSLWSPYRTALQRCDFPCGERKTTEVER